MNRPSSRDLSQRRQPPSNRQQAAETQIEYPLPRATVADWRAHQQASPQNPGLIFDRFAPDFSREPSGQPDSWKKLGLSNVCEVAKRADDKLLDAWNRRWQVALTTMNANSFTLRTDWRFIAGLGRDSSYEIGFTFHRYGFPVLPGSSVKGVARAAALIDIADKLELFSDVHTDGSLYGLEKVLSIQENIERDVDFEKSFIGHYPQHGEAVLGPARDFRVIFGTTAAAGKAIFFDAIPAEGQPPKLELDIMNPHYPQYYQGKGPSTDWENPVPVYFLTVAPGTEFRFAVGWRGELDEAGQRLRPLAESWLKTGLSALGAGSKTSAGYGYFLVPAVPGASLPETGSSEVATSTSQTESPPSGELRLAEEASIRSGVIVDIRPDLRFGRVRDEETGKEYRFSITVIRGNMPARRRRVAFTLRGDEVVEVRRL